MVNQLETLTTEDQQILLDAVPLVTVLIAGADGKIDKNEREWAEKLTKIRSYAYHESLRPYYERLGETFAEKVDGLIDSLPEDTSIRNQEISGRLEKVNAILSKLDPAYAYHMYKSLTSFANHVARSSGGFLGFGSASKEEKEWLDLPMITPIVKPEEE